MTEMTTTSVGEGSSAVRLQRRADRLRLLADLGALLNSQLDPSVVRAQAIDAVRTLLDCEASSLIRRGTDGSLSFAVATGAAGAAVTQMTLGRGEGVAGWVVEEGRSVVSNDLAADPRHSRRVDQQAGFASRSLVCVPLTIKGRILGALQAVNGSEPFDETDVTLLELLGQHVVTAMENARLYGELRESLVQLKAQQDALVQSEKLSAMGLLAAGVAHEIRSPLTAISGYAQLLKRRGVAGDMGDRLETIERSVEAINKIVNGLLDFAKKDETCWEPVNVNDVVEQALVLAEHTLSRFKKVRVERRFAPELPPVEADARQLQQVFINLIINAAEAMPSGGVLTITTTLDRRDDVPPEEAIPRVEAAFGDTGVGIPELSRSHIFEPFFTEGKKSGTGLGLSICKSIMKKHRGEISFRCPDEGGTVFLVHLPVLPGTEVRR